MTTVAFIGLGIMGKPMGLNLIKAGFEVAGFSRTETSIVPIVEAGGRAASSVQDAVDKADVVALMLPDGPDVEAVVAGPGGVLESIRPGTVIIDFSTIDPEVSRRLAAQAATCGVHMLDAPVSGGETGAIEGHLSVMVGGDPATFERVLPIFAALGTTFLRVGGPGAGQSVKAANQLVVAGTILLVAEAIKLLEASEVDIDAALRLLAGGLAGNRILDRKSAAMLARDFTPGFRVALHHKDMGIVVSAARKAGIPIPLGSAVAQLLTALVGQGKGDLDHGALLGLLDDFTPARATHDTANAQNINERK